MPDRPTELLRHRAGHAGRAAVEYLVGLGVIGALAVWSGQPLLFPSLGPTVMLTANACLTLAQQCGERVRALEPVVERYGRADPGDEPERLETDTLARTRSGPMGLLRDLQDLHTLAVFTHTTWTLVEQAAHALADRELLALCARCQRQAHTQMVWLTSRMKQAAPQVLLAV